MMKVMKKHQSPGPKPRRLETDLLYRERLTFMAGARPGLFPDEGVRKLLGVSLETFKRDRGLVVGEGAGAS